MLEPPPNPCYVCELRTTNAHNFLLNCCLCKRGFHHRCCKPPIPDEVLTSLVKASLKNKPGKGVKAWRCYSCREEIITTGRSPAQHQSQLAISTLKRKQSAKKTETDIIEISDDEDVPNVDDKTSSSHPGGRSEIESASGSTSGRVSALSHRLDSMEIDHSEASPLPELGLTSGSVSNSGPIAEGVICTTSCQSIKEGSSTVDYNPFDLFKQPLLSTPPQSTQVHPLQLSASVAVSRMKSSPLPEERSSTDKSQQRLPLARLGFVGNRLEPVSLPEPYPKYLPLGRSSRKSVAKKLDKNNLTPSQRSLFRQAPNI